MTFEIRIGYKKFDIFLIGPPQGPLGNAYQG